MNFSKNGIFKYDNAIGFFFTLTGIVFLKYEPHLLESVGFDKCHNS